MLRRIEMAAFASALIGAFVVAGAATSAMPTDVTRATQPSATCSAAEQYRRAKALGAYKKAMPKRKAAYFKTHKRAKQRAAFVKAQQAELKRLRQRTECSIAATPPGVAVPLPLPPGTSTVAAPTTSTFDGLPTSPPVSMTKPGATTTTTPVTTSTTTSTTTAASTTISPTTSTTSTTNTNTTTTSTTTTTGSGCAASYPDFCIPLPPPDLNCADVAPHKDFTVLWNVPDPDPHHFDTDKDGIGCEG